MEGMNFTQELLQYGALGIFCLYWMVRDWTLMKDFRKTIEDFKEILIKVESRLIDGGEK
jgi:hypothetical protein